MTTKIETYLNSLSKDISTLNISNKGIKSLPDLTIFKNLKTLNCYNNQLTSLPTLPQNLQYLYCSNNSIYEIVNNDSLITIKQNIQTLNNFRHLYYCLKFKSQFWHLLWKIKEPKIMQKYHPSYLDELLTNENIDIDMVLDNW